ncbi:MAG: BrnT family toxin, partial [Pseudomonadota bacterium]|nr:BrnT family toxin [Pseudomonadota bacterium]
FNVCTLNSWSDALGICPEMYEWDEAKRDTNLLTHGVDFVAMETFDWTGAVLIEDLRRDYGEQRFRALGLIGDRLHAVVVTPRADALRIVSLRRANAREQRLWQAG